MSKEVGDLFKASLMTMALFAGAMCVMQFLVLGIGNVAAGLLPWRPDIGGPSEIVALMLATGTLVMLGAVYLTACGFALLLRSAYLDHMLQIFAKSVMLISSATLGIIAGNWAYLRLSGGGDIGTQSLVRLAILLVLALLVCLFGRLENFRRTALVRVILAVVLILAGPIVLTFFG